MNLNILGSVTLGVQVILLPTILVLGGRLDRSRRVPLLAIVGSWLLLLAGLAAADVFSSQGIGQPLLGIAATAPIMASVLLRNRSATMRSLMATIPLTLLVAVHVSRLVGVIFFALHAAGRLPIYFAHSAGWGDIIVGIASVPLAILVYRRTRGWWSLLLAWNCLGVADLIVALALGAGSAAGSPIRFIYEEPSSALMGTLPWFLIPGYLVPLYLVTHVAIFFRLFGANTSTVVHAVEAQSGGHMVI